MTGRQTLGFAVRLLSKRTRWLLGLSLLAQASLTILDLVGVLLVGVVTVLGLSLLEGGDQASIVPPPLGDLIPQGSDTAQLAVALAALSAFLLLSKSIAASLLMRSTFTLLAREQSRISGELASDLLNGSHAFVKSRQSQDVSWALIQGSGALTIGLLGQLSVFVSEMALLVSMTAVLLFVNPAVTLGAVLYFGCISAVLHYLIGAWASRVGHLEARTSVDSIEAIQEALASFKELQVLDRRQFYVQRIQDLRLLGAQCAADRAFINQLPKYFFEAALVLGALLLSGYLLATENTTAALGTLAVFLAAGSRIAPSLLRAQTALLLMRDTAGLASPHFQLRQDLDAASLPKAHSLDAEGISQLDAGEFQGTVEVVDACYTYPGQDVPAIDKATVRIDSGALTALVGRSGAGKTTLADLILGVLDPDTGSVRISGQPPRAATRRWPGAICYVPQDVFLSRGTFRDNVALGVPSPLVSDEQVWRALEQARLGELVASSEAGLDTRVGERGVMLSGGQRQRLGIARALYSNPRLLVLDEATSALDAETEASLSAMIASLGEQVTTIVIAHRLSTVRRADLVVYVDKGKIVHSGTFAEVANAVPDFRNQASLMGLVGGSTLEDD